MFLETLGRFLGAVLVGAMAGYGKAVYDYKAAARAEAVRKAFEKKNGDGEKK